MKLCVVDGGKGGVGKSHVATALADRLVAAGAKIAALDGDITNPDFCRIYQERGDMPSVIIDLSKEANFTEMFSALEGLAESGTEYAVLSLAAGTTEVENLRAIAQEALEAMGIEVVTLFVMSKLPDSVNLAARSLERGFASLSAKRLAVLNGFHGKSDEFTRWAESKARKAWAKAGGQEAYIRELYYRVVDALRDGGLAPSDLLPHLSTIHRIQLQHWLREFDDQVMRPLNLPCPPPATATAAASKGKAADEKEEVAA